MVLLSEAEAEREGESLREQALRAIRAAIVYGELAPGELCSAPVLAEQIGVSVTPVREAMLELVSRGMIEAVRNRGFRVVERTPRELDDTLDLRMLIEVPTMVRLAGTLDATQLAHFRALVDGATRAARRADRTAFLELDRSFHLGLLALAGNGRIVDVVDRLRDQLRLRGFDASHASVALTEVAAGHGEILDAIAAGDAAAVDAAARGHLELTRSDWAGGR